MTAPIAADAVHDFDFFQGRWDVHHRRLKQRHVGSQDWDEFPGTSVCWQLLGGLANVDDNHMPLRAMRGMTLRVFDPARGLWSIWWVNGRDGILQPPVVGRFENGVGLFHGEDVDEERPIKVVYRWTVASEASARWEQAFSIDEGNSWETNWIMDFTRV